MMGIKEQKFLKGISREVMQAYSEVLGKEDRVSVSRTPRVVRPSAADFVADVEITIRRTLLRNKAVAVYAAVSENGFANDDVPDETLITLGAALRSRGVWPVKEYFKVSDMR